MRIASMAYGLVDKSKLGTPKRNWAGPTTDVSNATKSVSMESRSSGRGGCSMAAVVHS